MGFTSGFGLMVGGDVLNPVSAVINANTTNVNLFTLLGSPTDAVDATVTISAGVKVSSTSTGTAAIDTGTGWNASSTIKIVNFGSIIGRGGDGGKGVGFDASWNRIETGVNGNVGGHAINLQRSISIDNTASGKIFGGGGGGGGGLGYAYSYDGTTGYTMQGGGGGGGAGGGAGGTRNPLLKGTNKFYGADGAAGSTSGTGTSGVGAAGSISTSNAGGAGGGSAGGSGGFGANYVVANLKAGGGGGGGGYGSAGGNGGGAGFVGFTVGIAGAAGNAIKRNGNSVTWIAGNNATQVKGADA